MDGMMETGIALVVGLVVGFLAGYFLTRRQAGAGTTATNPAGQPDWWEMRKTLTGTQLQILQFLEAKKEAGITAVQEKFSFIPDRELYYRLEQIVLMGFLVRGRADGDVVYTLNSEYKGTVEDDKTVMMSGE